MTSALKAGLILNPWAGIGGSVALRGSDGAETRAEALRRGGEQRAPRRCADFLAELGTDAARIRWSAFAGSMGADALIAAELPVEVLGEPAEVSTAADTRSAAAAMCAAAVDLIIFVGGDGTARDLLTEVGDTPVLGVPAGVKMHSGVFAVSPRTAALIVKRLLAGELVSRVEREVKDFDADSSDGDQLAIRIYGSLYVPEAGGYLQQTKIGGKESEPLALQEICAAVLERLDEAGDLVIGPGSSCAAVKEALGMPVTLRGFDVRTAEGTTMADARAADLHALEHPHLIISFTRGQGFLFGRGNQQLDARMLERLRWPEDVMVIGTRTKLATLEGRPLLVDTGDSGLDRKFSGLVEVISGYEDSLLYRIAADAIAIEET